MRTIEVSLSLSAIKTFGEIPIRKILVLISAYRTGQQYSSGGKVINCRWHLIRLLMLLCVGRQAYERAKAEGTWRENGARGGLKMRKHGVIAAMVHPHGSGNSSRPTRRGGCTGPG